MYTKVIYIHTHSLELTPLRSQRLHSPFTLAEKTTVFGAMLDICLPIDRSRNVWYIKARSSSAFDILYRILPTFPLHFSLGLFRPDFVYFFFVCRVSISGLLKLNAFLTKKVCGAFAVLFIQIEYTYRRIVVRTNNTFLWHLRMSTISVFRKNHSSALEDHLLIICKLIYI